MLVPDGSESTLRQPISSVGHRHREDRPDTWSPSVPRQPPIVFTMPPHTTRLLILTHGDAVDPIPSAVQHPGAQNITTPSVSASPSPAPAQASSPAPDNTARWLGGAGLIVGAAGVVLAFALRRRS